MSLAPLYFVIVALTRGRATYAPEVALDRALPLQPEWMIVYGSLYIFVIVLPVLVVRQATLFRRAMQAYLLVMVVAYVGFVLYPTAAPRPDEVVGTGFAAWSLRLAYALDPPYGCFPSLHVAYAFVSALTCYRVHRGVGMAAVGMGRPHRHLDALHEATLRRRRDRRCPVGAARLRIVPAPDSSRCRG